MLQVEQRAARRAVRRLVLRTPVFVHRTVLACPMDPETINFLNLQKLC